MPLIPMTDAIHVLPAGWSAAAQAFAAFARIAAPAAIAALWQSVAVVIALVLCLRIAPRFSATHRFAAWAAGFAVVVGLPVLPLVARFFAASAAANLPLGQTAARPWLELNNRWAFIIAALWLIASCLRVFELAMHSMRLRRLWKTATPLDPDGGLRSLLVTVSPRHPIELCTTRELDRPSVIGFLAPRILIPEWLFSKLTPGELEQVVLHESEHLRRHDDWTNLLQKFFLALFPLNPALAWMERRMCREREMACDEGVVRRTDAPRAYAACLTALAEREFEQRMFARRVHALSLGAFERRPELVHRVHTILQRRQALHPLAARALVFMVGCGLVLSSVELARCPQVVAFATAQMPNAQVAELKPAAAEPAGLERASYDPASEPSELRGATNFRAIPAKAVLPAHPARRSAAALTPSASNLRGASPPASGAMESAFVVRTVGAPHAVLVKSLELSSTARAQGKEYVVFTAWEQVQASPATASVIADYDAGASRELRTGVATQQPDARAAAPVIFTRVILTIYPAGAVPHQSVPASQATGTKGSASSRSAAMSAGNGWLFFQL